MKAEARMHPAPRVEIRAKLIGFGGVAAPMARISAESQSKNVVSKRALGRANEDIRFAADDAAEDRPRT
jgi:hypothetical protein